MSLSTNNFAKDEPAKSTSSFAPSEPAVGSTPISSMPAEDNHVFEGDNTGAPAYGGDFDTFGGIYGQDNFGGFTHFKNRPVLPVVNH